LYLLGKTLAYLKQYDAFVFRVDLASERKSVVVLIFGSVGVKIRDEDGREKDSKFLRDIPVGKVLNQPVSFAVGFPLSRKVRKK